MKKTLLLLTLLTSAIGIKAQETFDVVSLGAGYSNQVWYSLPNDDQGSAPKNNWDLAFDVSSFGVAIFTNTVAGVQLYNYENGDISNWADIDTNGLGSWRLLLNSDTSWAMGAFNANTVVSNQFDVGWGVYNPSTHVITGDSLFIIKLPNGTYRKLAIESVLGGAYQFKYANLDGTDEHAIELSKANFTGKNFGYFSIASNVEVDREPLAESWDLLFTQYTTILQGDTPYTVSGVLSNQGVEVAQAEPVDPLTYLNYGAETFVTNISEIGYDWKSFNGTYVVTDTTVYFVKRHNGDIWKLVFAGFGGSSTGNFEFVKELLFTSSVKQAEDKIASIAIYPNPASGSKTTLLYSLEKQANKASLELFDLSGKLISRENLNTNQGLQQHPINIQDIASGIYWINVTVDGNSSQQKLIVR